jgi:hypothetical protein
MDGTRTPRPAETTVQAGAWRCAAVGGAPDAKPIIATGIHEREDAAAPRSSTLPG